MENFKSYGGVREIGPFHKNFSAVVGPNGSGKSNTIDALLFVFGKRAKQIRLNKVSELIHCSRGHENLPSAKVTVYFQDIIDTGSGSDEYTVVANSEVAVSREALRNNSSNYFIDRRSSSFGEVTTLLRARGIDLEHNRFLILQGEVEQISLMKPKGLTPHEDGFLEYLEDIIGTTQYNEPIELASAELDRLQEFRKQKLDRFRIAEQECELLDGPRKQAVAFVNAEKERLELESLSVQVRSHEAFKIYNNLETDNDKKKENLKDHRAKMDVHEKAVKTFEKEHNEVLLDYHQKKALAESAQEEFQEFERLDVKCEEDKKFMHSQIISTTRLLNEGQDKIAGFARDIVKYEKSIPVKEQEKQTLKSFSQAQQKNLEKFEATLEGKSAELRTERDKKVKELEPLKMKLSVKQAELDTKKLAAEALNSKKQRAEQQLEEIERNLNEATGKKKQTSLDLKQCVKEQTEKQMLVNQANERLREVEGEMDALRAAYMKARAKAEEVNDSVRAEQTRGNLIKRLYQAARDGILKGFRGRLGNLGTIDKKYDVAVSTACGLLDAIVVDTVEDAQIVVEYVRKEKLGRVTCIVLEKQEHFMTEVKKRVETPFNVPRVIDLIRPKEEIYLCAFFYALKNTLVADNLDDATKISYGKKRWRVVTLCGGLVDLTGTMTGGGTKTYSGGMSASVCDVSPADVQKVGNDLNNKKQKFQEAQGEKHELESALGDVQKDLKSLESRRGQLEATERHFQQQLTEFATRKKDHKIPELTAEEKKQLKEIEKELRPMQEKVNEILGKHSQVEQEIRVLTDSILNAGGDELRTLKFKVEEADKKVDNMDKQIRKIRLDIENNQKHSAKTEELLAKAEEDKKNHTAALQKLTEEHAAIDEKALVVYGKYEKANAAVLDLDNVLSALKQKRNDGMTNYSDLKKLEVDLSAELDSRSREQDKWNMQVSACKQKVAELSEEYKSLPDVDDLNLPAKNLGAGTGVPPVAGNMETGEGAQEPAETQELNDDDMPLWIKCMKRPLTDDEIASVNTQLIQNKILALEANLKNMKPNLSLIEEYKVKLADAKERMAEFDAAHVQKEESRKALEKLRTSRLQAFMDGFSIISLKLKEMYQMITLGGDAELELVDSTDPFSEGIAFSVRPPKKSWKQITNLSGGEKTLASLSLVFALHHYRPTPLYFMDEIDAALDFRNVAIIGNYIKRRTRNAQFIIISLRNHMFELADLLVGIYKTHDQSKCVAIDPDKFTGPPGPDGIPREGIICRGKKELISKNAQANARGRGKRPIPPPEPIPAPSPVPVAAPVDVVEPASVS
eukprot:GEMP01001682.1.p1 GENE.GEMP01001682.1~~GEMP01001682.1.p1  ORF type:complete len:1371 (+),score=303.72 GEMP01001682.1:190-4113(+)